MTARRKPDKPLVKQCVEFVIWHLADKRAFAPFTGTDYDAWNAYIPTVRLWGRMRDAGTQTALREIVACAQRSEDVLAAFKKAIPCILDWSDEPKLWMNIAPRAPLNDVAEARMRRAIQRADLMTSDGKTLVPVADFPLTQIIWPCPDGPRICHHDNSKPYKFNTTEDGGYLECKDCGTIWKPRSVIKEAQ